MSTNIRPTFRISHMQMPVRGATALPVTIPFATAAITSETFDLYQELEAGEIGPIQSVWVDNSKNAMPLTLNFPGIGHDGHTIEVAPNAQGMFPVLYPVGRFSCTASTAGNVDVDVIFIDVPEPYYSAAVTSTQSLVTGAWTDYSGVIAAANVSQLAIAANTNRKRAIIQNPSANNTSLFVNFGAVASEDEYSEEILPGGSLDTGSGPLSTQAINIISATLNQPYTAKELA